MISNEERNILLDKIEFMRKIIKEKEQQLKVYREELGEYELEFKTKYASDHVKRPTEKKVVSVR